MQLNPKTWDRALAEMLTGNLTVSPFTEAQVQEARACLLEWAARRGHFPTKGKLDKAQLVRVRELQAFLRACGDPDAEVLDAYARGVSLGYKKRIPRAPAIFEQKVKWRLPYEDDEMQNQAWVTNYGSARERNEALSAKIKEDLISGRMIRTTYGAARRTYGEKLLIGALGMIEEGPETFRLIHDGTHRILMNNRVRVLDQVSSPMINDLAAEAAEIEEDRKQHLGLVWDFKGAHRIVAVAEEDWGLQACSEESLGPGVPSDDTEVILNTVGTFGVSTAGYWWARLGAAVTRAGHYVLSYDLASWILLYADDGKATITAENARRVPAILFAVFLAFGFPIKWNKVRGGQEFQWIGYTIDLVGYQLGISKKRQEWVVRWLKEIVEGKATETDFDSGLGRLCFVTGAIIYDRPFLAPFFSLAAITRKKFNRKVDVSKLPPYIKLIALFLMKRLQARRLVHCTLNSIRPGRYIERFRSDAKAEGELVTIGGYETHTEEGAPIEAQEARWFFVKLSKHTAPWAFEKGEPFRAIASLELLGSLLGVMLLVDENGRAQGSHGGVLSVGALTDNSGNRFAVTKMLSTKWPLTALVAELAAQLERRQILFQMDWVPREQNQEADSITNGNVQWLNSEKEVHVKLNELPFEILPVLLAEGSAFYAGLDHVNVAADGPPPFNKTSLRVRDPFG